MPEQILPIEWPKQGLVEAWSFSDQPEGSAREYQNVRVQDPTTGRLCGAQRAGMSKYVAAVLKTLNTKAWGLTSFFVNNRQVTYSAASSGAEVTEWNSQTPSKSGCKNLKTDRQGNLYALDGNAALVKYSSDGEKLWQLAVGVDDPDHAIRALAVSDEDLIYVGVSSGGDQEKAKIFCYEQLNDDKTRKLWDVETKAYIEDMIIFESKLYTCQNRPDRAKAMVRVYEYISSANPEQSVEFRVPYPANSIAVKEDGSMFVACEPSGDTDYLYWRLPDPKYPEASVDSVDWTPKQLTNSKKRIWSWFTGDSIDQTDVVSDIANGVEVSRWQDDTENYRHVHAPYERGQGDTGPTLALDCYVEHKGLRFSQPDNFATPTSSPFQTLISVNNSSFSKGAADTQGTVLPAYTGGAFALYIVCRPEASPAVGGDYRPRHLFAQDQDAGETTTGFDNIIFTNAYPGVGAAAPSLDNNYVLWHNHGNQFTDASGVVTGVGYRAIKRGRFDIRNDTGTNPDGTTTNLGRITILGCIEGAGITTHLSQFSVNGSPLDLFTGYSNQVTGLSSCIGIWRPYPAGAPMNDGNVVGYKGDILEILALDLKDRDDPTQGVLSFDALQYDSASTSQTVTEAALIQGYLAHKYGAQINLPYGTAGTGNYPHPFGITGSGVDRLSGPPNQAGTGVSTAQALANKRFGCVVKYSAEGKIKWCANEMELQSGSRSGGYGYAVAVNSDGNIYSLGPNPTGGSGETVQVRMIIDQGDTFSIDVADGAWSASFDSNLEQTYKYPRVDVDEFDNLYIPYHQSAGAVSSVRVYKKDGTVLHDNLISTANDSYAVAVDRRIPEYRSDLTTKRVEFVFVGGEPETSDDEAITKLRLVNSTQSADPIRQLYNVGVSGGDIKRFTTSAVTAITGGTGALDGNARYIHVTNLFRKAYWTDGASYKVYDPITNEVTDFKCLSAGQLPPRCSLVEAWRGRLVLARSADEPHNWFLSKKDDPTNWDYFPAAPDETTAIAGNNSATGLCPDIINTVVPYSEDILVFGGDHSIWMLVGDPAAGGRLELVSDITGMAFGRPWCKDPHGVLYFIGSRGGMYRWRPGSQLDRVSLYKIERQLQQIDFENYYVKLAWNHHDEGVHILQMPFGAGGTHLSHWFYEAKTDSFSKDIFGTTASTNVQPTDVLVIDDDAYDDRAVVFACEDGHIRKWDPAAASDDTKTDGSTKIAIDAYATIFPIASSMEKGTAMESQFSGLTVVLNDRQAGCRWELFASDEPDQLGSSVRQGVFGPGRNPPSWERVTGAYCGLRLRNAAQEERFAFERAYIYAAQGGMVRPRNRN